MLAKWHAIPDPITPEPSTATFFILRIIFRYFYYEFIFLFESGLMDARTRISRVRNQDKQI